MIENTFVSTCYACGLTSDEIGRKIFPTIPITISTTMVPRFRSRSTIKFAPPIFLIDAKAR